MDSQSDLGVRRSLSLLGGLSDLGQHEAHPRIVGIECDGASQEAFPFPRIAAEEARQLDEHLSLCGQRRRIVRGERQRDVDLPLHSPQVAERREQPPSVPLHLEALAEVTEDGEVRDGIPGVCSHGLLGAGETAREHRRALRDRDLIRLVAERDRVAGRRAGRLCE